MTTALDRRPESAVEPRSAQRATIDWGPVVLGAVRKLDPRG